MFYLRPVAPPAAWRVEAATCLYLVLVTSLFADLGQLCVLYGSHRCEHTQTVGSDVGRWRRICSGRGTALLPVRQIYMNPARDAPMPPGTWLQRTAWFLSRRRRPAGRSLGLWAALKRHRMSCIRRTQRYKVAAAGGQSYYWDVIALSTSKRDFPTSYKSSGGLLTFKESDHLDRPPTLAARFFIGL